MAFTPYIVIVLTGLIAGWFAGLLAGGGLIRNLLVGIIGAFIGGALVRYELLALPAALTNVTNAIPYGTQILISTIGAIIAVIASRVLRVDAIGMPGYRAPSTLAQASIHSGGTRPYDLTAQDVKQVMTSLPAATATPAAPSVRAYEERSAVFLSYRRADSADVTGRIYDRLVSEFGRNAIFKDVDTIPFGADFRNQVLSSIEKSRVVLTVIGRYWLVAEDGRRRLEDMTDMVRIELEAALEKNIPIIPVLVQGVSMPSEGDLPSSLKQLAYRNGLPVRPDPDFSTDMTRLLKSLRSFPSQSG